MREAEKVEGFRFTQTTALSVVRRMAAKLQQSRLLRVQFQLELSHSFSKFLPKLFGIVLELESNHGVVGVTHHDYIAVRALPPPCLNPEIEDVMEIDVGQQRRSYSPYTKGNFDLESRLAVDCRLAGGPAAGLKCYGES